MSQSTIDNRNGSKACVFIAFNFGLLYKQFSLDNTLVGESLNSHWQTALEHVIRAGNDSHIHGTKGAVIARFNPDSHCQAQNFAVWLDQMLIHTKGVGLSICSIASILSS